MKTYSKEDVEFHAEGYNSRVPAINVKVYHYPSACKIADHFNCSEEQAEQAGQFAFDSAQYLFWQEDAPELAENILAPYFGKVTVYSEGRSGGWLVVKGVGDVADWDAIALAKWRKFERAIKATVDFLGSWEYVKEDIRANRWAEDGAALYNFFEFADGHSECLVDMKQEGKACPACNHVKSS